MDQASAQAFQAAMAQALSGVIDHEGFKTLHTTVQENHHVWYAFWIILIFLATTGFFCIWCWLLKRAVTWIVLFMLFVITVLLLIDIGIRINN
jgi:ABC-type multidrug transport system permease subunit